MTLLSVKRNRLYGKDRVVISFRIPRDDYRRLEKASVSLGMNKPSTIRFFVNKSKAAQSKKNLASGEFTLFYKKIYKQVKSPLQA